MARSKKEKERVAKVRAARLAAHNALQAKEPEVNDREEFRKFFIKIKNGLKLAPEMEEVIWTHFKSAGFAKAAKFKEGIKHFGYKL